MDMFLIFVRSTPRPMLSPDTVSNFSVSQCDHTCSMVRCHNHFSTASPQRDYMSYKALYDILCSVKRHMNARVIFRWLMVDRGLSNQLDLGTPA